MREMKDSGIEWVGQIPFSWDVKPIRAKFREVTEKNKLGIEKNALKFTYGNIVKKDNFDAADDDYVANTILNYMVVNPGTIMLNGLNLNFDFVTQRVALVKERGIITSAYIAFAPILDNDISAQFFTYLLKAYDSCKAFHNMGGGVRKILNFAELKKQYIVYPTLTEQKRIANFLDAKCEEIDALADDIQTQIETLEQYKRSIISETVTEGLNPNVQMNDSGLEWIKKIPKEWEVNRIKYLFKSTKGLSITKENLIEEGLPVISYGQIHSKMNTGVTVDNELCRFVSYDYSKYKSSKIEKFDFAFADTSEDYEGCGNCVYKRTDDELYGGYHVVILKSVNKKDNRYFAYLFQTDVWRKQIRVKVSGVKVYSITQKIINEASVIIPPVQEQEAISNFLDTKCSEINEIIMKKKEQLEVLNEYKKSLIYEYVTGKREVPAICSD